MAETDEPGDPRVEIAFSKPRIFLLILYNTGIVGLGLYLFMTSGVYSLIPQILLKLTAGSGMFFFGSSSLLLAAKLFTNKPGFVIDQHGFIDNADAVSAGRINWENMTDIEHWHFMGQALMLVKVKAPQEIMQQQSLFKRLLMYWNMKRFGTPVSITCGALEIRHEQLYQLIMQNFNSHAAP